MNENIVLENFYNMTFTEDSRLMYFLSKFSYDILSICTSRKVNQFFLSLINNTNDGRTSKHSEYDYAENDKLFYGNVRFHLVTPEIC